MTDQVVKIQVYAATTIGRRKENQDIYCVVGQRVSRCGAKHAGYKKTLTDNTLQVFAVFDGMGGTQGGMDAAAFAAKEMDARLSRAIAEGACSADGDSSPGQETQHADKEAVRALLGETFDHIQSALHERGRGGSTAVVAAILPGGEYVLFNIGDSPAFYFTVFRHHEVSRRQNRAYEMQRQYADEGVLFDESNGMWQELSAELCHCLGAMDNIPSRVAYSDTGRLRQGDRLILCTDGVASALTPLQMDALRQKPRELVDTAVKKNGDHADNATVLVIEYGKRP